MEGGREEKRKEEKLYQSYQHTLSYNVRATIFAKFSDIFIDLSSRSSIRYLTNQKKKKKKSRILIHPSPSSILSLFLHSLTHRELNSRKRSNLPLRFPDGEQTSALLFPLFFFPFPSLLLPK